MSPAPPRWPLALIVLWMAGWSWWAYTPDDPFFSAWRGGAVVPSLMRGVDGAWWRLVTAGWLHLDAAHLLGNALAFVALGRLVQRLQGAAATLGIFGAGALVGAALSLWVNARWTVGASGGVFALLGALVAAAWQARGRIQGRGRVAFFALCLLSVTATQLGGTDTTAHYAGLGLGVALGAARGGRVLAWPVLAAWLFGLGGALTLRLASPSCEEGRPSGWRPAPCATEAAVGWSDGLRTACVYEAPPPLPKLEGPWRRGAYPLPDGRQIIIEAPSPRLSGPWLACMESRR
ncbi:rhomboid family intramembrane serine protease [Myxococcota bacterium]|nr:rhomboid family intramembrane serine protease [Myxococcota bacterium]MBU1432330.1 rhomboid family intramembrane serine protease [Myxococcota bacterium]MBU1897073.1 rhomboid family intramembrane serine protease [Myxococcota bacterium]